jgi:hypothetical protein
MSTGRRLGLEYQTAFGKNPKRDEVRVVKHLVEGVDGAIAMLDLHGDRCASAIA